jgi:membrane carboxypeptidase/penicillin-binding protein
VAVHGLVDNVGGKTGTTDDARDAWFAGIAGEVAVVVWVGRDQGEPLGLGGATAALPIWAQFVDQAGLAWSELRPPAGVEEVALCPDTGQGWTSTCPVPVHEWFQSEGVPSEECWLHSEDTEASEAMP